MANSKNISLEIIAFHGITAPEQGKLVGYGAIIDALKLPLPIPLRLALISKKHRQYATDGWLVLTPRHQPEDNLYAHLVFALKYEGVNLLFFKNCLKSCNQLLLKNGLPGNRKVSTAGESGFFMNG